MTSTTVLLPRMLLGQAVVVATEAHPVAGVDA